MDVAIRAITPSARRHGISQDRIHAAIKSCPQALSIVGDPEALDLILFLGHDRHGILLEIVAREHDDGAVTVFHAMRMRPAYRSLLPRMGGLP